MAIKFIAVTPFDDGLALIIEEDGRQRHVMIERDQAGFLASDLAKFAVGGTIVELVEDVSIVPPADGGLSLPVLGVQPTGTAALRFALTWGQTTRIAEAAQAILGELGPPRGVH